MAAVGPGRGHRLLTLRYVDGLSIEEVCAHFAISQSQYFREHRRGLDALVSLLWEQWEHGGPQRGSTPGALACPTGSAADRRGRWPAGRRAAGAA